MVGRERQGEARKFGVDFLSPLTAAGNSQNLMLYVDDVDAHCARARAAGARIVDEPALHDYGDDYWADRSYGCVDRGTCGGSASASAADRNDGARHAAARCALRPYAVPSLACSAGTARAGELARRWMPPPLLSRHLRVLRRSGLIADEEQQHDARVRLYRLQPQAFGPLREWLDEIEAFWGDQLQALKAHAERPVAKPARSARAIRPRPKR
jgi:DNA-binding transcriptional ArsR family regulator